MRWAILAFLLACSHPSKGYDSDRLKDAQTKGASYYATINESIYTRCDKLAFKPYLTVAGYIQDLSGFEDNGKWSRDIKSNPPCYPTESKGSISFDGMIAVLHHIWTTQDRAMLDRLITYGNSVNWVIGEGAFANQIIILPLATQMRYKLENKKQIESSRQDILKGFRGHLLASYIWLQGRMNGAINTLENEALKSLFDASPDDPMYLALHARYNGGDQARALDILLTSQNFPAAGTKEVGIYNWGSSPAPVYYLITLSIIERR